MKLKFWKNLTKLFNFNFYLDAIDFICVNLEDILLKP